MTHSPDSIPSRLVSANTARLLVLAWLVVGLSAVHVVWNMREAGSGGTSLSTIDPNQAPWWELSALPQIGPALARRIVNHRETVRAKTGATVNDAVYDAVCDLDAVEGIGPKTIARLAPHLRFDKKKILPDSPRSMDDNRQSQ